MKNSNVRIYIIILIIAVIIGTIMMALAFFSLVPQSDTPSASEVPSETPIETTASEAPKETVLYEDTEKFVGLIEEVQAQQVFFYDITNDTNHTLDTSTGMEIRDKYGEIMAYSELKEGDIVDVTYNPESNEISKIYENSIAWEQKNVTDISNDTENNIFTINGSTYRYDDNVIIHNGESTGISSVDDITSYDIVDLRGYSTTIYYIDVISGHGAVAFTNSDHITNPVAELDNSTSVPLTGYTELPTSQGSHDILVTGDNIEPFVKTVQVNPNQTTVVDLNETQIKQGLVTITTNVNSPIIFIDEVQINLDEPLLLDYGTHTITCTKDGYIPYEGTFDINSTQVQVDVTLDPVIVEVDMSELRINSEPQGADVYVDNQLVGQTPINYDVEYGDHAILVTMDGYTDMPLDITASEDVQEYLIRLQEEPDSDN